MLLETHNQIHMYSVLLHYPNICMCKMLEKLLNSLKKGNKVPFLEHLEGPRVPLKSANEIKYLLCNLAYPKIFLCTTEK